MGVVRIGSPRYTRRFTLDHGESMALDDHTRVARICLVVASSVSLVLAMLLWGPVSDDAWVARMLDLSGDSLVIAHGTTLLLLIAAGVALRVAAWMTPSAWFPRWARQGPEACDYKPETL